MESPCPYKMKNNNLTTLTVETLQEFAGFSNLIADLVKNFIIGIGAIISAASYVISVGRPISTMTAIASRGIEGSAVAVSAVIVSFIRIGATISRWASSFGATVFGPLGVFAGRIAGYAIVFAFKVIGGLIGFLVKHAIPFVINAVTLIVGGISSAIGGIATVAV